MTVSSGSLKVHYHISSETGLSSVISIVIGSKSAIIINPPLLIADANSVVEQTKSLTSNPVVAVFVTHRHPDHYFSANPILHAFPKAKFYAAPYVRAGIDREYDEKVVYWPKVFVTHSFGCRWKRRSSPATRFVQEALMLGKPKIEAPYLQLV
jgi:glyoxylase-like metal-dependent hydrolase (beta-lactamase superfamily II)